MRAQFLEHVFTKLHFSNGKQLSVQQTNKALCQWRSIRLITAHCVTGSTRVDHSSVMGRDPYSYEVRISRQQVQTWFRPFVSTSQFHESSPLTSENSTSYWKTLGEGL
jgi:hypothetical protein